MGVISNMSSDKKKKPRNPNPDNETKALVSWQKNPERKRQEAQARDLSRDKLSPTQQLAHLDARLGAGIGAKKERAKLTEFISNKLDIPKEKYHGMVKQAKIKAEQEEQEKEAREKDLRAEEESKVQSSRPKDNKVSRGRAQKAQRKHNQNRDGK